MNYKQLLILRLSNLTEWKNEREMIIPEEMRKDFGWAHTCEFLDDGKYILRCYYKGGHRQRETECQNGQRHGLDFYWYKDGQLYWKIEYQNGQSHGVGLGWWESGQPKWKTEFQNNLKHGFSIGWHENGQQWWEAEYKNGVLIRNIE